jgi:predicted dehydrogenase
MKEKDHFNNSRRKFILKSTAASTGIAFGLNTFAFPGKVQKVGASDKIRVGFIGVGNRGSELLNLLMRQPDCEVAALCDIYEPYVLRDRSLVNSRWLRDLGRRIPKMGEKFSKQPNVYSDYRKLLDDKQIDAVCIATPDHWHALQTIDAIKAGKDVYVEKPLTVTIREGREMVNAQKAGDRVVTVGLHRRGNDVYRKLAEEVPAGIIGKVVVARAARISNMAPDGIGKMQPEMPPKDFNWNMWLGPRAYRPYQYNIAPYKFRWWSDYSTQMGNWGVHYLDVIRWMMGEKAPVAISAQGGQFVLDHDGDIPDTIEVTYEFASGAIASFCIYEACGGEMFPYGEVELRGTKGTLYSNEKGYQVVPAKAGQFQSWDKQIEETAYQGNAVNSTSSLIRNFLDCIKSRETPYCPLEEGHRSTSFAHLANISLAMKQRLEWDPVNERFTNSEKANELLSYNYRAPWKI